MDDQPASLHLLPDTPSTIEPCGPRRELFDLERAAKVKIEGLDARERELDDRAAQLQRTEELLREREARMPQKAAGARPC